MDISKLGEVGGFASCLKENPIFETVQYLSNQVQYIFKNPYLFNIRRNFGEKRSGPERACLSGTGFKN